MPDIEFDYGGQTFEATVADAFLKLDKEEQARRLEGKLKAVDVTKGTAGGKGFLHALSLIERPAQALKVGLKESIGGGELYRSLGGVDTTPQEGFFTGAKRGWLGEEAVRTQDFLPEDLPGWYRGLLGFAGDVATDPITYSGALLGKSIYGLGKGIKAVTPRPVAEALQGLKEKDVVQDFARAINVPLGDSKIVKNVGQLSNKHRAAIDRELAEELPKVKRWLEDTGKYRGQTSEDMNAGFREWMDRPRAIPITKKMREKEPPEVIKRLDDWNKKVADGEDAIRQRVEGILGKDGIDYVDKWSNQLDNLLKTEQAAGLFTRALIARHYFPRFVTPHGRESLEKAGEEFFPSGMPAEVDDPLFFFSREPFRNPRVHWEGLDEVNLQKWRDTGGTTKNPADIPYEDRFFHTDVPVALGLRWVDHAAARQKKWFIDTVTDSGKFPEGLAGKGRPHMEVGRWIRKDPADPDKFQERFFKWDNKKAGGPGYVDDWRGMSDDVKDWVDVRGIPRKYADEDVIRTNSNVAAEAEMAIALTKGVPIKDAMKLSEAARKKVWADSDRVSQVFKAPKQVAKQIEQELQLMGAMSPSDDALKNFFKVWDEIQNPWKAWTLAVRPAYHTRNAVGNIYNAYIVTGLGSNIPKAIETFTNAAKLQYYSRFEGSELLRNQAAKRFRDHDKNIRGAGVESLPKIKDSDWVEPNFADTGYTMKEISEEGLNRGINAGHYRKDIVRDDIAELEYMQGRGLHQKRARLIGQQNPAIKIGFAAGGTIEGNARYAIFIDTLNKIKRGDDFEWIAPDGKKVKLSQFGDEGNEYWTTDMRYDDRGKLIQDRRLMTKHDASFDIAANKVKEALFDYSDLSLFERNIMKRVMPFYTWSRKNFPVQIKHLALNPQRAEKLHLAKEQFEHDTGDLDYSDYGAFWGKRVPVFLGK